MTMGPNSLERVPMTMSAYIEKSPINGLWAPRIIKNQILGGML